MYVTYARILQPRLETGRCPQDIPGLPQGPGFRSWSYFPTPNSRFWLMHTLGGIRCWLQHRSPYYPLWFPTLIICGQDLPGLWQHLDSANEKSFCVHLCLCISNRNENIFWKLVENGIKMEFPLKWNSSHAKCCSPLKILLWFFFWIPLLGI